MTKLYLSSAIRAFGAMVQLSLGLQGPCGQREATVQRQSRCPEFPLRPDWRDPEQYRPLLALDKAGWAAEWLRRSPDFADVLNSFAEKVQATHRPIGGPRIIILSDLPVDAGWGVIFCRCHRTGRHLLVSVAGPCGPHRRGVLRRTRRRGRFRRAAAPAACRCSKDLRRG